MLMFRFVVALLLILAPLHADTPSVCDSTSGNWVNNCGFEAGDFSFWITGGNFDSSTTFIRTGLSHSGTDSLSFGAVRAPATVSQTLADPAGLYLFSFYLRQEFDPNDPENQGEDNGTWTFRALWNGNAVLSLTNTDLSPFTLYQFAVTGTGNDTIEFDGRHDPFYWALDDVAAVAADVVATPEPYSMILLLTVLTLVGVIDRRYRRSRARA